MHSYRIGVIGSGFIGKTFSTFIINNNKDFKISKILTRTDFSKRSDLTTLLPYMTNSLKDVIDNSDIILECSGDVDHACHCLIKIMDTKIPVVTMNTEFHVTCGPFFYNKMYLTEAEGDQPGSMIALYNEVVKMGFIPRTCSIHKRYLNKNPSKKQLQKWANQQNISLEMTRSFTNGTKVNYEMALIANYFETASASSADNISTLSHIIYDDRMNVECQVLRSISPGISIFAEHSQKDELTYYKLPKYAGTHLYSNSSKPDRQVVLYRLERPFHLCHLEIIKTIEDVIIHKKPPLLQNTYNRYQIIANTLKRMKAGKVINLSYIRGIIYNIEDKPKPLEYAPFALLKDAVMKTNMPDYSYIRCEDVDLKPTLALDIWRQINK